MGIFLAIVFGFLTVMSIAGGTMMFYFMTAMNNHDAEKIDPRPQE
ncbi:hypothetical protein ACFO0S_11620 [Chryseomicrobium palamuruense]|uniref:Uncharacterized protein n=1 Tax=Chryseomicrobium palamuruense TaxID=682973 RepID=A0ABV8UWI3_9BACL